MDLPALKARLDYYLELIADENPHSTMDIADFHFTQQALRVVIHVERDNGQTGFVGYEMRRRSHTDWDSPQSVASDMWAYLWAGDSPSTKLTQPGTAHIDWQTNNAESLPQTIAEFHKSKTLMNIAIFAAHMQRKLAIIEEETRRRIGDEVISARIFLVASWDLGDRYSIIFEVRFPDQSQLFGLTREALPEYRAWAQKQFDLEDLLAQLMRTDYLYGAGLGAYPHSEPPDHINWNLSETYDFQPRTLQDIAHGPSSMAIWLSPDHAETITPALFRANKSWTETSVTTESQTLDLCPDFESKWGVWSSTAHIPDYGVPIIPNFSAPEFIWKRILDWHAHWEGAIRINRELERYEWASTLPLSVWLKIGNEIADELQSLNPDWTITRGFARYARAVEVGPGR